MAITAAIAMSAATVTAGTQPVPVATVTVTNGNSAAASIVAVEGYGTPTSLNPQSVPLAIGACEAGSGAFPVSVAASGTGTGKFAVRPYSGVGDYSPSAATSLKPLCHPAQRIYDIGARVWMSDGSLVLATTATLTVNAPAAT